MEKFKTDIMVVGGGGAGLAAARTASTGGASVAIVDDNPAFGGQIWRSGVGSKNKTAGQMIRDLELGRVRLLPGTAVFDAPGSNTILAKRSEGTIELAFSKLIIATGARERFIPFPGWTLPNVFGAGGLQALVKGGLPVSGRRVIVSGTGPLLLAVADYLASKGAEVLFVAEQVSYRHLATLAARLIGFPSKLAEAAKLRIKKGAVKIRCGSIVTDANGEGRLESVTVNCNGEKLTFDCDLLAAGFHLVPNLELPRLLGLNCRSKGCDVDEYQRTRLNNVFAAGETTGIGGIELSLVEGEIAGYAAIGNKRKAASLFKLRGKYKNFARILNQTFELKDELRRIPRDETIVCRCEDVPFGDVKLYQCWRDAKLQTRCGMGLCQGKICGSASEFLFGWEPETPRPPLMPVKLKDLV